MRRIAEHEQRSVEERLLGLGLGDSVLIHALARIASIPIKADYERPVQHKCILWRYTLKSKSRDRPPSSMLEVLGLRRVQGCGPNSPLVRLSPPCAIDAIEARTGPTGRSRHGRHQFRRRPH